jgi:DNA-binding HxlR family transcriptional regulator
MTQALGLADIQATVLDGLWHVSMKDMTINPRSISNPVEARGELRRALATISGKWKLEILWLLNQRVHRFGERKRAIPGITQRMLTSQLRELEDDGLVSRTIFVEIPPRVDYAITDKATELRPVIDAIFVWWRRKRALKSARAHLVGATERPGLNGLFAP